MSKNLDQFMCRLDHTWSERRHSSANFSHWKTTQPAGGGPLLRGINSHKRKPPTLPKAPWEQASASDGDQK